jgi:hypothetical protein
MTGEGNHCLSNCRPSSLFTCILLDLFEYLHNHIHVASINSPAASLSSHPQPNPAIELRICALGIRNCAQEEEKKRADSNVATSMYNGVASFFKLV